MVTIIPHKAKSLASLLLFYYYVPTDRVLNVKASNTEFSYAYDALIIMIEEALIIDYSYDNHIKRFPNAFEILEKAVGKEYIFEQYYANDYVIQIDENLLNKFKEKHPVKKFTKKVG